jgi:hypothetical protein
VKESRQGIRKQAMKPVRLGDYVDEIRSFGLERLQALDFATVAAIVSVHTNLQRICDASDREVRVLEGELAGI